MLVLLGTAVLAPFSTSMTTAYALDEYEAAMIERHSDHQAFSTAEADAEVLELDVTASEDEELQAAEAAEEAENDESAGGDDAETPEKLESPKDALYTLDEFIFSGVVNWGGYKFTYYSQQVLPGPGLVIPGRHVNSAGYVSDEDGYIVLAGDAPKGTVYPTPFGYEGKIYDRGTVGNHLDVYIR